MVGLLYIAALSVPNAYVSVDYRRHKVRRGDIRVASVRNFSYVRRDLIFLRGSRFLQPSAFALRKEGNSIGRRVCRQIATLVNGKF
jgi:hypothetical protein